MRLLFLVKNMKQHLRMESTKKNLIRDKSELCVNRRCFVGECVQYVRKTDEIIDLCFCLLSSII